MQDERRLAPRSASPKYVVEAIRRAVTLQQDSVFYDLGCGADARILIAMAQAAASDAQQQQQQQQLQQPQPSRPWTAYKSVPLQAAGTAAAVSGPDAGAPHQHPLQETAAVAAAAAAADNLAAAAAPAADAPPGLPHFVGVELDPAAAAQASAAVAALPAELAAGISIIEGDLLQVPLHNAAVVYAYLLPQGLSLLASKLSAEAPPGCTLLSYMFKVPGWEQHLQATLLVTSGLPGRPDVSGVSKLYIYQQI